MYKEAFEKYAGSDPATMRAFAAGFVSGQAEKVYLGACKAAMFRPSQDRRGMIMEIVEDVAKRYDLAVVVGIGEKQEIWICRHEYTFLVESLRTMIENTFRWHVLRGGLCGVPPDETDVVFHERAGHGGRCD